MTIEDARIATIIEDEISRPIRGWHTYGGLINPATNETEDLTPEELEKMRLFGRIFPPEEENSNLKVVDDALKPTTQPIPEPTQ